MVTSVKEIETTSQEAVTVTMDVEERDRGELMLVTSQSQPPMVMRLMPEQRLDHGAVLTEEIETVERVTNMTATADGVQPANNRSIIFIKKKKIVFLTLYWFHFSYLLLLISLLASYTLSSIMCG